MLAQNTQIDLFEDWKNSIRDQKLNKAKQCQSELSKVATLNFSQAMIKQLNLLNTRTALLEKNIPSAQKYLIRMEKHLTTDDKGYSFYYHYLNGLYNFLTDKHEQAIYQYKMAEKKLKAIEDPIEIAEYHYNFAAVYYEIDKITLSLYHVSQAFDIFKSVRRYKRMADCQCLLGSNHNEIKQYSEAERHYFKALKFGEKTTYPEIKKIVHHNLGFFYSEQKKSNEAIKNLQIALELPGKIDSESLVKTYFLLSRETYRLGEIQKGNEWYEKGFELASDTKNQEYLYHFRILKTNYDPDYQSYGQLEDEYIDIINYFVKNEIWYFVGEYSNILAQYYRDNGDFELACEYYDLMVISKEKLEFKGVLHT